MRRMMHATISAVLMLVLFVAAVASAQAYNESPTLAAQVAAGELPPIEERLPLEPVVIEPTDEIGIYGGTIISGHAPNDEYLLMLDRAAVETIPNLAKGWEFNEDGTSMTLYLREGLKWSDGVPFTVDDMIFWYEDVALNQEITPNVPQHLQVGGELIEMVKVDDYTVRFNFARPFYAFIHRLDSSGFEGRLAHGWARPAHWFKQFHIDYNPEANELAQERGYDYWYQLFGLYNDYTDITGEEFGRPSFKAWILQDRTPNGNVYVRNPYYFKVDTEGNQLPYIDRLLVTLVESDAETRLIRMLSGEIDFNSWGTSIGDFPTLKRGESAGNYRVWIGRDLWGSAAVFNINQTYDADPVVAEYLQNRTFRQALSLAIDREEINEVVALGQATPRQATFHPDTPGYQEEWGNSHAQYDPAMANQLLDSIGLDQRNSAGWRVTPGGQELTLIIPVADAIPFWIPIVELVRDYWRQVGVRTEMRAMDTGALTQLVAANEAQIFVWVMDNAHPVAAISRHAGFMSPDFWMGPWGVHWATWFQSDGREGIEPPEDVKEIRQLALDLPYVSPEEQVDYLRRIAEFHAENLYMLGTIGMAGKPVLAHVDLGNVREDAIADNADVGGNRNQWMEEFYWKSAEKRGN